MDTYPKGGYFGAKEYSYTMRSYVEHIPSDLKLPTPPSARQSRLPIAKNNFWDVMLDEFSPPRIRFLIPSVDQVQVVEDDIHSSILVASMLQSNIAWLCGYWSKDFLIMD